MNKFKYIVGKSATWMAAFCMMVSYTSCSEEEPNDGILPPTLSTVTALNITRTSVTLTGGIQGNVGLIKECGVKYSTSREFPEDKTTRVLLEQTPGTGSVQLQLTNLSPNEQYYYCWFASTGSTEVCSNTGEFTTAATSMPTFGELVADSIGENYAKFSCNIEEIGDNALIEYGISYKTSSDKTYIPVAAETIDEATMRFEVEVRDLKAQTTYSVRAYAKNSSDASGDAGVKEGYSQVISITTKNQLSPQVSTYEITTFGTNSISVTGTVTAALGSNGVINECGFCWSDKNEIPSIADNSIAVDNKSLNKDFSYTITDLLPETTYYICAYAKNTVDGVERVGYGEVYTVTTGELKIPQLNFDELGSEKPGQLTARATIQNYDEGALIEKGFIWDTRDTEITLEAARKNNSVLVVEDGAKVFKADITGLLMGQLYYVRAYAIYEASGVQEIGYSGSWGTNTQSYSLDFYQIEATTNRNSMTLTSGIKSLEYGEELIEKGFCWRLVENNTLQYPTLVEGEHTGYVAVTDGTSDNFTAEVKGLLYGREYCVRPYAIVKYGDETMTIYRDGYHVIGIPAYSLDFNQLDANVVRNSMTLTSGIKSLGDGDELLEKGFCWLAIDGEWKSPTLDEGGYTGYVAVTDGSYESFTAEVKDLLYGTEYCVRPYAKVKCGDETFVVYSNWNSSVNIPSYNLDFSGIYCIESTYTSLTIKSGIDTILEDGEEIIEKGFCWKQSDEPVNATLDNCDGSLVVTDGTNEEFSTTLTDLEFNTHYYYQVYVKVKRGSETLVVYSGYGGSSTRGFSVGMSRTPAETSVDITAYIHNLSEIPSDVTIEEVGYFWVETTDNFNFDDLTDGNKAVSTLESDHFSGTIENLEAGKQYYVGIYVKYNGKVSTHGWWDVYTTSVPKIEDNESPTKK